MTSLPTAIHTVWWMVRDTFRQSLATRLFWAMAGITALCVVFCLGVSVTGDDPRPRHPDEIRDRLPRSAATPEARAEGIPISGGRMSLGFGLYTFEFAKDRSDAVRLLQLWLAGVLADTAGVLLALVWTAGFLPAFLDPQAVAVLLAKPAPRWSLLVGKYLGVVLFVAVQATLFVAGTWFGLGVSTGVWDAAYWLAVPLLVIHFAAFYAFGALLAVCTRSTVVALFGTLLFWLLCWGMNFTHHRVVGFAGPELAPTTVFLLDAGYWMLPKPLDLSGVFFDAMRAGDYSAEVPELRAVRERGLYSPGAAVATSLAFALGVLALAAYEFRTMDY